MLQEILNARWWEIALCITLVGLIVVTAQILRNPPPYSYPSRFKRAGMTILWWASVAYWGLGFAMALLSEVRLPE